MVRRKRRLTPEEAELWRSVARTTRRLGKPGPDPTTQFEPPPAEAPQPSPTPRPPAKQRSLGPGLPATPLRREPSGILDFAPDPLAAATGSPPRIGRRRYDRMIRGKMEPEGRIDLHGMTRDAAHAALTGFVLDALARGLRLVLVITGKGRPDTSDALVPERTGILRHSLPHWLSAPPLSGLVLEIRPAHRRHGGAGAVYLYLRRRA